MLAKDEMIRLVYHKKKYSLELAFNCTIFEVMIILFYAMNGGEIMKDIMIIYNNFENLGIKNRTITEGQEIRLVREYIDYRSNLFKATESNKLVVFIEPQVGNAYPDIVFVEYDPNEFQTWNQHRNILSKKDLKILFHIHSTQGIDFEGIVSQLGYSWKDAAISAEKLFDAGLIIRENRRWMVKKRNKILPKHIEAVEAKINKWDEVLQQSIINRNFASESYALIESKNGLRRDALLRFNRFGVGLYHKKGDTFETIKKAKCTDVPLSFHSIMFNEWIGRILCDGGDGDK